MADRPVECSHCKKKIKVIYKEIVDDSIVQSEMCADCPVLERRLYGDLTVLPTHAGPSGLYCGKCKTSLEEVKMGNPLGCDECYDVFADVLIHEIEEDEAVCSSLIKEMKKKPGMPLHVGRSPYQTSDVAQSSRLTSLHQALNEALSMENYEQAAWIRDQIKEISKDNDQKK